MTPPKMGITDYPLAETRPALVCGQGGKPLADITLEAVVSGRIDMADLRITGEALRQQAEIANDAGRPTLGDNFERAAELVAVPQDVILRIYELLRPGRAQDAGLLHAAAALLRNTYGASRMADFVEEAAAIYIKRGLFHRRF